MRRLVCACVVREPPKTGFLAQRPISSVLHISTFYDIICVALFIPRHFEKCGVLCYTLHSKIALKRTSVRPSVHRFHSAGSIFLPIFFKLAMRVDIGKECPGIEDG